MGNREFIWGGLTILKWTLTVVISYVTVAISSCRYVRCRYNAHTMGCTIIRNILFNISNFTLTFQILKLISLNLYKISERDQPLGNRYGWVDSNAILYATVSSSRLLLKSLYHDIWWYLFRLVICTTINRFPRCYLTFSGVLWLEHVDCVEV